MVWTSETIEVNAFNAEGIEIRIIKEYVVINRDNSKQFGTNNLSLIEPRDDCFCDMGFGKWSTRICMIWVLTNHRYFPDVSLLENNLDSMMSGNLDMLDWDETDQLNLMRHTASNGNTMSVDN